MGAIHMGNHGVKGLVCNILPYNCDNYHRTVNYSPKNHYLCTFNRDNTHYNI